MVEVEKLAINGGPKAVTLNDSEATQWPPVGEEEVQATVEALRTGQFIAYYGIRQFESDFANYHGIKYALAQNNGTSTLHAAYFAAGVGPGDEVIVPSYQWHLAVTPILACHGVPVFCEIDPKTLTIDPNDIEKRITERTKAICVVHIWGIPADMDPVMEIARAHDIAVIEDCSHAHGNLYKGRKVGTIGDMGCFSLQMSKSMTGGEAGIFITNNYDYYARAILLGHYELISGLTRPEYRKYGGSHFGFKYRINPLAAVIARVQLKHLDERNVIRRANMEYLTKGLTGIDGIEPPYVPSYATMGSWYGYRLKYHREKLDDISLEKFVEALKAEGVDASEERYPLVHLQPMFQEEQRPFRSFLDCPQRKISKKVDLPITEDVYSRLIALPVFQVVSCKPLLDQYIEAFSKVVSNVSQLKCHRRD
jgi:perosamine synthetase